MSSNKTVETEASVETFINSVEDDRKKKDSWDLVEMMTRITGKPPRMWGSSLVGFGRYHYRYASGREGDFFVTGFSPRKTALTVYVMPGFDDYAAQLDKLGPFKTGKSCLYLKNLDTVDRDVLESIIADSVEVMRSRYECE
jgi:hypothetical protein